MLICGCRQIAEDEVVVVQRRPAGGGYELHPELSVTGDEARDAGNSIGRAGVGHVVDPRECEVGSRTDWTATIQAASLVDATLPVEPGREAGNRREGVRRNVDMEHGHVADARAVRRSTRSIVRWRRPRCSLRPGRRDRCTVRALPGSSIRTRASPSEAQQLPPRGNEPEMLEPSGSRSRTGSHVENVTCSVDGSMRLESPGRVL